jgi:hypothetical protein
MQRHGRHPPELLATSCRWRSAAADVTCCRLMGIHLSRVGSSRYAFAPSAILKLLIPTDAARPSPSWGNNSTCPKTLPIFVADSVRQTEDSTARKRGMAIVETEYAVISCRIARSTS